MFKYNVIIFIVLAVFLTSGKVFSQNVIKDNNSSTITGTVTFIDSASDIINVKTGRGNLVFFISVESDLIRSTHHIATIEINKGDPVIIEYKINGLGKNIIIKLVDNKPDSY